MKIRIVFDPVRVGSGVGVNAEHGLQLNSIVNDEGVPIEGETVGTWLADGDVEALELELRDKVWSPEQIASAARTLEERWAMNTQHTPGTWLAVAEAMLNAAIRSDGVWLPPPINDRPEGFECLAWHRGRWRHVKWVREHRFWMFGYGSAGIEDIGRQFAPLPTLNLGIYGDFWAGDPS